MQYETHGQRAISTAHFPIQTSDSTTLYDRNKNSLKVNQYVFVYSLILYHELQKVNKYSKRTNYFCYVIRCWLCIFNFSFKNLMTHGNCEHQCIHCIQIARKDIDDWCWNKCASHRKDDQEHSEIIVLHVTFWPCTLYGVQLLGSSITIPSGW